MALGFGRKKEVVDTSNNTNIAAFDEKSDPSDQAQYDKDPEKAEDERLRKMSRVGGPLTAPTTDDEATIGVAKQIELEQTDSIKYRTCSWQKVGSPIVVLPYTRAQGSTQGCERRMLHIQSCT